MQGSGMNYELECQLCTDHAESSYVGETSRNLFTRSREHLARYRAGTGTSFMLKHQSSAHQGEEVKYRVKVTSSTRDCLSKTVSYQAGARASVNKEEQSENSEWKI